MSSIINRKQNTIDLEQISKTKFSKILELERFRDVQVGMQGRRKVLIYSGLGSER